MKRIPHRGRRASRSVDHWCLQSVSQPARSGRIGPALREAIDGSHAGGTRSDRPAALGEQLPRSRHCKSPSPAADDEVPDPPARPAHSPGNQSQAGASRKHAASGNYHMPTTRKASRMDPVSSSRQDHYTLLRLSCNGRTSFLLRYNAKTEMFSTIIGQNKLWTPTTPILAAIRLRCAMGTVPAGNSLEIAKKPCKCLIIIILWTKKWHLTTSSGLCRSMGVGKKPTMTNFPDLLRSPKLTFWTRLARSKETSRWTPNPPQGQHRTETRPGFPVEVFWPMQEASGWRRRSEPDVPRSRILNLPRRSQWKMSLSKARFQFASA